MSENSLRRLLERLGSDAPFVERLKEDPEQALSEFDLGPTERAALVANDEDGLRRLAGLDASGFMLLGSAARSWNCNLMHKDTLIVKRS